MPHILYLLFIAPLEFLLRLVLEWGFSLTHSWGWSLVLLSLAVNTAILPIYNWAEKQQEEVRELRRSMSRPEAMLHESFKGQEHLALVSCLRRLSGCNWRLSLRASAGLLVQIPFFIAAFHLLSEFAPLRGQSFGPLSDLAAPDALLGGVNLLPFVMTAANLLAAFVYAHALSRSDRVRIYCIALLFLVLLYPATSALVLYWTLNNLYSLGKNSLRGGWMHRVAGRLPLCPNGDWTGCGKHGEAAGTWRRIAARCARAGRSGFGVGLVFWLWTCVVAFDRHGNLLDADFKSAMVHFGGQCLLTAFGASLAQAVTGLSACQRASAGRALFRLAGVAVLYLLQLAFFTSGFAIVDARFPFDMWDGRGTLFFALWALGIVAARRCGETARVWAAPLLRRSASRRTTVRKPLAPPVPNSRATLFLDSLLGGVCALFLWLFIPFSTFFHNVNEFEFGARELLANMPPYILATFLLLTFFFWGCTACCRGNAPACRGVERQPAAKSPWSTPWPWFFWRASSLKERFFHTNVPGSLEKKTCLIPSCGSAWTRPSGSTC